MPATTTLLGLVTPTQGTLSGTWGDTVNYGISDYVDIAVAGTLTLTNDGAVTLANTTGSSSGSSITSSLTGAGTVTAQFAIVKVTGTLTVAKVVTGPSYSKTYTVVNSATGGIVTFKASGQTGVSIAVGETAFVYFNGTDYVKIVGTATAGAAGGSNTQVQFNSSGILSGSSSLTWDGTTLSSTQVNITGQGTLRLQDTTGGEYVGLRSPSALGASYTLTFPADDGTSGQALITDGSGVLSWSTAASGDVYGPASATDNALARFDLTTGKLIQNSVGILSDAGVLTGLTGITSSGSITFSSLTSGRVPYATTAGLLTDSANLLYSGTDLTVYGLTVGRGAGAVSTNAAMGNGALAANTTGSDNASFGRISLAANTTGISNSGFGSLSLNANTTGGNNSGIGYAALYVNTTGQYNTAVGSAALQSNTTASGNTAVGYQAAYTNTVGSAITALGYQAGYANTGGSNTFLGYQAGVAQTTATDNTLIGAQTGLGITTGGSNVAVGGGNLYATTTGTTNAAFGWNALRFNTTGSNNTALGYQSLYSNTTAFSNTAVGFQAAYSNTTGTDLVAVGTGAAFSNTTGVGNMALGQNALYANTTGIGNTAVGTQHSGVGNASLNANTTGSYNTAVGTSAMRSNTTASNNTAVGYQAAYTGTTALGVTAVGSTALKFNTGNYNTGVGLEALLVNTTGVGNTAMGVDALYSNTTASNNSAFGRDALLYNTTGASNVAVGSSALQANTTASNNTAVGYQAGYNNTTGATNAFFGYQAGYNNIAGVGNTFIGMQAGSSHNTAGNTFNTFVGYYSGYSTTGTLNTFLGEESGQTITTGSKNTIVGRYNGNQGGLDIRTASNYVVLSDGDGVPHAYNGGSDWYLAPNYRSFLTRGNNGGGSSTGSSGNFFKIGTWHVSGQGARATLRISGSAGFGTGDVCAGETVIFLVYQNSNDAEGFFYSVTGGAAGSSVSAVAVKNTAGAVEVWVKTATFASTAVFPDCVISRWEGAYTDTGSTSTPAGATLLSNQFRYTDSSASDSSVTLNQFGVGVGNAAGTSGRGITFPATQSASSNANTLDDYEEGTWTPTYQTNNSDIAGFSYAVQSAKYVKIGKLVTVNFSVSTINAAGMTGTGGVVINGLPFSVNDVTNGVPVPATTIDNRFTNNPFCGFVEAATGTSIRMYKSQNMNTAAELTVADFTKTNTTNYNLCSGTFSYTTI